MVLNPFKIGTQNYRLLRRLFQGPCSHMEMCDPRRLNIPKYTSRVSDIRGAGIPVPPPEYRGGLRWYHVERQVTA